jgi:galactokinase
VEDTRQVDPDALSAPGGSEWFDYVAAVAWALADAGQPVGGIDMVIAGNIPIGAGLSSSAALEVSVARALCEVSDVHWDPPRMAQLCQRGENCYVGVKCGIMDQYVSAVARAGCALLIDCRTLSHDRVAIPSNASFVVLDTGVRRSLAGSEYNERRANCDRAVALIAESDPRVSALRDVEPGQLAAAEQSMDAETYRRAQHVVEEMSRPKRLTEALNSGDLEAAGRVINESHASLRDLYEVSGAELDEITELARNTAGCYGARMTGAGFGGCAVALVETTMIDFFVGHMRQRYTAPGGGSGYFHPCVASDGAELV